MEGLGRVGVGVRDDDGRGRLERGFRLGRGCLGSVGVKIRVGFESFINQALALAVILGVPLFKAGKSVALVGVCRPLDREGHCI